MATHWHLTHCTIADSPALTHNNIPAFWADPHWVLAWKHRTLSYHLAQVAKRTPRTLLTDRRTRRHQKAVDPATGSVVGYARWVLPASRAESADDGTPAWPEAVVPAVSAEEEAEIRRVAGTAHWDPNEEADGIVVPVLEARDEILGRGEYMILDYLAVHPTHQRKGIGTALVESGIRQAKELGLDIFVYAKKNGAGLYKRLGFRIERDFRLDDSQYGGEGEVYVALMIYGQERGGVVEGDVVDGE